MSGCQSNIAVQDPTVRHMSDNRFGALATNDSQRQNSQSARNLRPKSHSVTAAMIQPVNQSEYDRK